MASKSPATERNGRKLRGRDREPAALALAAGRTVKDAAFDAGVSERAVSYWVADPAFRARVSELRQAMYAAAVGRLAELSGKAADTLGELLGSEAEQVKLAASRAVLEYGPRLREQVDFASELAELRETLNGGDTDATPGTGPAAGSNPGPVPEGAGDAGGNPV